jgi:hypothetical protein
MTGLWVWCLLWWGCSSCRIGMSGRVLTLLRLTVGVRRGDVSKLSSTSVLTIAV